MFFPWRQTLPLHQEGKAQPQALPSGDGRCGEDSLDVKGWLSELLARLLSMDLQPPGDLGQRQLQLETGHEGDGAGVSPSFQVSRSWEDTRLCCEATSGKDACEG